MSIRAAILGPTGYTGLHLIRILQRHPAVKLTYLASHREKLPNIVEEFPQLLGVVPEGIAACRAIDVAAIAGEADVVFLGLPHRVAMAYVPRLLGAGLRVIDLSADYRLKDAATYESTYEHAHTDQGNIPHAVYGLPELFRDGLRGANLIANPGCYPTACALALAPLLKRGLVSRKGIVVNAASGVTGAGRSASAGTQFAQVNGIFQRPSDNLLDHSFAMQEIEPGLYRVILALPKPGRWNLVLRVKRGAQLHELHASTSVAGAAN